MRNLPHKVTGDDLTADEFNDIPEEEENLITSAGIALTAGDLYQIAKAVATYTAVGDFYTCTNSGNDYTLTPISSFQAPPQYLDGLRARFWVSAANTGTVRFNLNALGWVGGVKEDGVSPFGVGDLPAGQHAEVIYKASSGKFELYSHKYEDQAFQTGWWTYVLNPTAPAGWITYTADGTIGSASSLATIRANADCEALFTEIWNYTVDGDCPVDTGRGANAAADWSANKRIHVPKLYDHVPSGRSTQNIASTTGSSVQTLATPNLAEHLHDVVSYDELITAGQSWGDRWTNTRTRQTAPTGSGVAFSIMQPTIYHVVLMKL